MALLENAVLSASMMALVDQRAESSGISVSDLMERAGAAVAASALRHFPQVLRFAVLCGPGNNGGDGYVAARYLRDAGACVCVFAIGDVSQRDDATGNAARCYEGSVEPLGDYRPANGDVVIDAFFGAGLSRSLSDDVLRVIEAVTEDRLPVIAVDLPSGIDGNSGAVLGGAFMASHCVTFAALKPGHVLLPGRDFTGKVELVDIGIPLRILASVEHEAFINAPSLWRDLLPSAGLTSHKFKRGHLTVFSGPAKGTGAARLCAQAALHAGAGIIAVTAPDEATAMVLAHHLTAAMVAEIGDERALANWLSDERHQSFVIGPGFGDLAKLAALLPLLGDKRFVLDADAITALAGDPALALLLFQGKGPRIMTPHEGEFARLFPEIAADKGLSKVSKARAAAKLSNTVVIYKGADTVIASPDGRAAININAPPSLATAGSGDVLAGICGALLAQDMPAFQAACAAVWLHSDAANRGPRNLNAEQLAGLVQPYCTK
jgi:hydroxyethylthiazole kinase-like uncharacterized protein yjeF